MNILKTLANVDFPASLVPYTQLILNNAGVMGSHTRPQLKICM